MEYFTQLYIYFSKLTPVCWIAVGYKGLYSTVDQTFFFLFTALYPERSFLYPRKTLSQNQLTFLIDLKNLKSYRNNDHLLLVIAHVIMKFPVDKEVHVQSPLK